MGEKPDNQTYSEVVESGIGQPTPGDVFGELIQHLGVLGLGKKKNIGTGIASAHLPYHLIMVMLLRENRARSYC